MKAAGVVGTVDCPVIKGIGYYADSHKNYIWQVYASATAAAYAKMLHSVVRPVCLDERPQTAAMRAQLGPRLPPFTKAKFTLLREAEVDFYGMNYYTAQFARHRAGETPAPDADYLGNIDEYQEDKNGVSIGELRGIDWLRTVPRCFRKHLVRIHKKYKKPIYITENGCPYPGKVSREDCEGDTYRQRYFAEHLDALVEVAGYFAWSLMDNFEWSSGYSVRFKMTFIDYATLERTPKESALLIRGMIEQRMDGKSLE
ncbi:glycoside hydrolase superfamily [Aspergillus insuetus]